MQTAASFFNLGSCSPVLKVMRLFFCWHRLMERCHKSRWLWVHINIDSFLKYFYNGYFRYRSIGQKLKLDHDQPRSLSEAFMCLAGCNYHNFLILRNSINSCSSFRHTRHIFLPITNRLKNKTIKNAHNANNPLSNPDKKPKAWVSI